MTHPVTIQTRKEKADFAAKAGIDEAFISRLVDEFYLRVRADPEIGPIFAAHIEDWDPHLARMKDFWFSIAVEAGRFQGNPMVKHMAIDGLNEAHFQAWLKLFNTTLEEIAPSKAAVRYFKEKSQMIGQSLLAGIEASRIRKAGAE